MGLHAARAAAAATAIAVLVASAPAGAGPSARTRARAAVRYLVEQQQADGSIPAFSPEGSTADAVVSMVAARRAPGAIDDAIAYLRGRVRAGAVSDVGTTAKVVMAVVAAGRNPRRFGDANLVATLITSQQPDGRLGAGTPVFHHALAMLALEAAGEPNAQAAQWLADAQCRDGGWQFDEPSSDADDLHCFSGSGDFFTSETDATGLAVQALAAAPADVEPANDPFAFLRRRRDDVKGGWGYSRDFPLTSANSTALAIGAYAAAGREVPSGARRALRKLQYRLCGAGGGAFAFSWADTDGDGDLERTGRDTGATIAAILGLLERPLPVAPADVTKPAPRLPSCSGASA